MDHPRPNPDESPMRTDITFRSGNDWCAGWLYRPEDFEGPRPLMVLAHGFSATKELAPSGPVDNRQW